ncbi:MAG: alpha-amylase family glycosyl hydrolase [Myxococcota bacterium]
MSLVALCLLVGCASSGSPVDTDVAMDGAEATQDAPPRVEAQGGGDDAVTATETPTPSACSAPAPTVTRWYDDAVGYEIFVRSFRDSDGDGIGDLAGLTASLDYLNDGDPETTDDLGVTLLWLMPIHQSPSYHGYDVTDYDRVDTDYGTEEDLTAMLKAAEARGIRVVIDLVLNHSSSQHPWFIDAQTEPSATYRNFYVWSDNDPGWSQPWSGNGTWHPTPSGYYYGLFWGGMPDLNFASEAVQATMTQVARDWLGRGVAGYRLDAVRYLVETGGGDGQKDTDETLAYWRRLREATDTVDTDTLLLGEAWADSSIVSAYFGDEDKPAMHMAFDFETASGLETALVTGQGVALRSALCARLDGWPNHGRAGTFATNHDMRRLASRLKSAGPGALHLIAAALMTLPGTPWLYYGQELGLLNGPTQDDIDKRLPMQWHDGPGGGFTEGTPWAAPQSLALADSVAGQTNDPESLLSRYRDLIALRAAHPALRRGSVRMLSPETKTGSAVAFYRELGDAQLLVLLNPTESEVTVTLTEEMLGGDHRFSHAHGTPAATPQAALDITKGVTLSGFGYRVLVADRAE